MPSRRVMVGTVACLMLAGCGARPTQTVASLDAADASAPPTLPRPTPSPTPVTMAPPARDAHVPAPAPRKVTTHAVPATGHAAPRALDGCPVLPSDNIWHSDVSHLAVASNSATLVSSIGTSSHLHPDFGSGDIDGSPFGMPITTANSATPRVPVSFDYADESDPGPYPIPSGALVEGGPDADGDRHVLVEDTSACRLYELFDARRQGSGWHAGSGAVYDLRSDALRPAGWTSADAAGLPIVPGLVRYDEVAAGHVDHAIRMTVPRSRDSFVWPARHAASNSSSTSLPRMGERLRLRANVDISGLPPQARVVAQAMKRYGMIVADNGSAWYFGGTQDDRWDNDDLGALKRFTGSQFEVVDTTGLEISPNSGAARPS